MARDRSVLFHTERGEGEPLLLLNGIAMTVASWEPIAARLEESHRVIRCDLRGQLMTPGDPPPAALGHALEVLSLLDHLGVDRADIAATSFGGAVAAVLAARWPDRVRSLVSIASTDAFDEEMADEVERWRDACLAGLEGGDRGLLYDVMEGAVYSPAWLAAHLEERAERRRQIAALPERWFRDLAALLASTDSIDLRPELDRITCPTLVAAAELDGFIPRKRCRALAEGIRNARFEVIGGAGHAAVVESPAAVASLCREFLSHVAGRDN